MVCYRGQIKRLWTNSPVFCSCKPSSSETGMRWWEMNGFCCWRKAKTLSSISSNPLCSWLPRDRWSSRSYATDTMESRYYKVFMPFSYCHFRQAWKSTSYNGTFFWVHMVRVVLYVWCNDIVHFVQQLIRWRGNVQKKNRIIKQLLLQNTEGKRKNLECLMAILSLF